jgi:hypothetical protein
MVMSPSQDVIPVVHQGKAGPIFSDIAAGGVGVSDEKKARQYILSSSFLSRCSSASRVNWGAGCGVQPMGYDRYADMVSGANPAGHVW